MSGRRYWSVLLVFYLASVTLGDDWPQWRGPQRDGVLRETGLVEKFASEQLVAKWRVPVGSGYSGPTVAGGRVYLMDRQTKPAEAERILCFSEATGETIWSQTYECRYGKIGYQAGPRASVTVADGRAFALGALGHIHCCDAADGRIIWSRDLNTEYKIDMPIWGIAGSPLLVGDLVILHIGGADGACVVALEKKTGKERWRALNDRGQYSAPIVIERDGRNIIICWTGDSVAGIHATDGKVEWRFPFKPRNMPIGIATPLVRGDQLFVTSFYDGSLMLRMPTAKTGIEKVWQRCGPSEKETDALQSIISTPLWLGEHIYGVDSHGELRCLDAKDGERIWENLTAVPKIRWGTIHFVLNGDRVWMFNERGELMIAKLTPAGFQELSRAKLLDPTTDQLPRRDGVCWSHPAFANRHIFARNDKELVCASLAAAEK